MMDETRREQLEQALLDLDEGAMVLEELDGFIAGVLVCPETIPPGEWFAAAMGLSPRHPSPFADLDHANVVLGLVMEHYDDVATTLQRSPERYRPLLPVDERTREVIWEIWIEGFAAAADLRPDAWGKYLDIGGATSRAMTNLVHLIDVANDRSDAGMEAGKQLQGDAEDVIRGAIVALEAHRRATPRPASDFAAQPNPFVNLGKVGRNDPCPCGSGRKYKRCCGAA